MARQENLSEARMPVPGSLRIVATLLRTAFICILLLVIARVSMPQSETVSSVYETPNDLIRLALGVVICVWLVVQLFRGPTDASGYRTWLYLGATAIPLALLCLFFIW